MRFWFLIACLFHLSCGGGKIDIDITRQGQESGVNGLGTAVNAQAYFTTEIYPLLIRSGGCDVAGCHLKGSAQDNSQTAFQVNAGSASDTWNWAQVRKSRVITTTGYASSSSKTLKARKDENPPHNSFSGWSDAEKSKLDTWTNTP